MKTKIREATINDLEETTNLAIALMEEHEFIDYDYYKIVDNVREIWVPYVEDLLTSKSGKLFLLTDNRIRGYTLSVFQSRVPIYKKRDILYLGDIYVEPVYRGGPAMRLLRHTFDWALEQDVDFIEFQYNPRNNNVNRFVSRFFGSDKVYIREKKQIKR